MQPRLAIKRLVLIAVFAISSLVTQSAHARAAGIAFSSLGGANPSVSTGCSRCHNASAAAVTATITGPLLLAPSATGTYTIDMLASTARPMGGIDVASYTATLANVGTLSLATGGNSALTRTIVPTAAYGGRTEITHSAGKMATAGHVLWDFRWTAPATCGVSTTLYAWVMNADNSGDETGDNYSLITLVVGTNACGALLANGAVCTVGTACMSGNCVDGVCCNTACGGGVATDCQACNAAGALGTCGNTAAGTVCRAAAGACDAAETCNGTASTCPADARSPAGTVCRAAVGACDAAETCNGTLGTCPADALAPAGTVCRASAGACDAAETCNGTVGTCPADAVSPATTVCRASAGACDVAENCNGTTGACPADAFMAAATVCRAPAGACDVAESCTGAAAACPADVLATAGTVCRIATGVCDIVESCTGTVANCPADALASSGTSCSDGNVCNGDETCNGSGVCSPGTPPADASVCAPDGGTDASVVDVVATDVSVVDVVATDASGDVVNDIARQDGARTDSSASGDAGGDGGTAPTAPGCGCRTAGSNTRGDSAALLALFAVGLVLGARRRRAARRV